MLYKIFKGELENLERLERLGGCFQRSLEIFYSDYQA